MIQSLLFLFPAESSNCLSEDEPYQCFHDNKPDAVQSVRGLSEEIYQHPWTEEASLHPHDSYTQTHEEGSIRTYRKQKEH